jgi:hypothetical protein
MGGMNEILTDNNIGNGKPDETALSFVGTSQLATGTESEDVLAPSGHRRNGKVARLPKGVREQINELIDDGVEYDEIIKTLGVHGKGLTKHNISQWARGGYCDWVKEQERKVLLAGNFEKVVDTMAKASPEEIPDLVTKLLAARMGGLLSELTPQELQQNSEKDPRTLARLLALVPKLSREALRTRKYREGMERQKAAEIKQLDPKREFDDSEHLAIVDHVNRLFGLRQYRKSGTGERTSENEHRTSNVQHPTSNGGQNAESTDAATNVEAAPKNEIANRKYQM